MMTRAAALAIAWLALHAGAASAQTACTAVDSTYVTAGAAPPLAQRVTVRLRGSLRAALEQLAAHARVRISYSPDVLPLERTICVDAVDAPLNGVLHALLADARVRVLSAGTDHAIIAPAAAAASADSVIVLEPLHAGALAGGTGELLPGVRVVVVRGWPQAEQTSSALANTLNQAVPGLWLWQQSPGAPIVQYGSMRGASSFGLTAPKLYIDGVEVANPLLFTRVSMDAIERLEIVRGPQGSALFGANAMNGVVNIITRQRAPDSSAPRTLARSAVGVAATDYAAGTATRHEHGVSTVLGEAARSLVITGSAGGVGEFVQNGGGSHYTADASARALAQHAMLTATLRYMREQAVTPLSPLLPFTEAAMPERMMMRTSMPITVQQYTAGASVRVTPNRWWTHSAIAGIDGYGIDGVPELLPWATEADLALRAAGDNGYRTTARLHSEVRGPLTAAVLGSLSVGVEHTQLLQRGATIAFPRAPRVVMRPGGAQPAHEHAGATLVAATAAQSSSGLSAQSSLAVRERLFLTAALRLEQGSSDVSDDHLAVLPLLGGSYLHAVGALELKLRASYGRGVRWAQLPVQSNALPRLNAVQRSSLVPEEQSGFEAGFDVMLARSIALHVTRFDQTAVGLVQRVTIALADSGSALRALRYELQNVGEVGNRGWELEAAAARGPLSLAATAAFVDSRVRRLAREYNGDLQPGDRMLAVPANTVSLTAAYAAPRWSASITAARAGDWINYDRVALAVAALDSASAASDIAGPQLRRYWRAYDGVTQLRARATHTLTRNVTFVLTADNLLDQQIGEPDNITVVPGRGISLGLRASF